LSRAFIETEGGFKASLCPLVLWVGRLDSLKRWRAFLEIAKRLSERTDAEFLMVSAGFSGDGEVELRDAIKSLELEKQFRQIRAVEHSRMSAVYRAVAQSGGCLVSTSANESFGMAVLEAMACGCPVVVPDVVGLRDLVRHADNGRLYPAGELAVACEEIIETLNQPPELRRIVTERAVEFALSFSPERAANRFLAVLADWSAPRAVPTEPQSTLAPIRQSLSRILAEEPEETPIVIFPPSLPWTAEALSNRPQRWARAFARLGCLVFYCDSQRLADAGNEFTEVETRIFAINVPLEVYSGVKAPIVVADPSNLDQLRHFCDPLVLYECRVGVSENESLTDLHAEWLARANVVTLISEESRNSIARRRPDAILVSDEQLLQDHFVSPILNRLKSVGLWENDPFRLGALLKWRERQVHALEREIQDRDRPSVEILRDAVAEQKHVLADRDRGIAFLRREVAAREKIIADRTQAVEFLENVILHRDAALAYLQKEIESRDEIILERQNAIEFLRQALDGQRKSVTFLRNQVGQHDTLISERQSAIEFLQQELAAELESVTFLRNEVKQREDVISERQNAIEYVQQELAAQRESVEFLRDEVARRDSMISERQNAVAFLQQELDVRRDGIAFLQDEVAKRDGVISERQNAIEFLRQELDARDVAAAAQLEGIAFLREEVAQRELALADRESKLLESEATIASLRETLRDFEIGVSRSADENYAGRERMEN
jgi:uncharacterized protein (DUF3084 family)